MRILALLCAAIATSIFLSACAGLKPVLRTIDDAAIVLCEIYAVENEELLAGMSPGDFCAIKENIQPFIDEALAAKQAAGQSLSRAPK